MSGFVLETGCDSGGAKKMIMVHGDDQKMIKCSTWKKEREKQKWA
jgi:hypothetical protein